MVIAQAALVLMLGSLLSRVLGLAREQVIAGLFGAGAATDALTAATRVPLTLYDLLLGGIIAAALVPVLTECAVRDPALLRRAASSVLNLALLGAVLLLVPLELLAPRWMSTFVQGFDRATQQEAIALVQWMLPALLLMAGAGVLTALHYTRQQFLGPALALSAFNTGIVLGAWALHEGLGTRAVAVGLLMGAGLQLLLLAPALRGVGYELGLGLNLEPVRHIGALALPVYAGLLVSTLGVALDTNLASRAGEGSLAALRFATTLVQLPLGLVATATGMAVLPALSRAAALAGDGAGPPHPEGPTALSLEGEVTAQAEREFQETLALALRLVLLIILPVTAALVALREPVVRLLFQHGLFSPADTERTARAFLAYAPGLPAAALDQLLILAFYARKDTLTPVMVGVVAVGLYLVAALALLKPLGYLGLALANSAQWIGHFLLLGTLLWRRGGLRPGPEVVRTALASAGASLALGIGLRLATGIAGLRETEGTLSLLVGLGLALAAGGGAYLGLLALLRQPELAMLAESVRRRLRGR